MGKEASKHKPMDKTVSSTTALKVSPGGKYVDELLKG